MSRVRKQLHAARDEYLAAGYPGDLADLLRVVSVSSSRWTIRRAGFGLGLAAAAACVVLLTGVVIQDAAGAPAGSRWQALLPTYKDLPQFPHRGEMAGAVKSLTPPEVPDLLMDVKQPLESSGEFIVNIGKDVAHHADALFHMG